MSGDKKSGKGRLVKNSDGFVKPGKQLVNPMTPTGSAKPANPKPQQPSKNNTNEK